MPLSVKDGMGAWVKDFQDSNAPQFKGKSDKERREMAIAAYMSAKRGGKNEAYDNPPFEPDPPKKKPAKNSDDTATSPMSRARQLARQARDRNKMKDEGYVSHAQRKAVWANRADGGKGHPDKKNEAVEENVGAPQTAAHRRAQSGSTYSDLQKLKKDKVKLKGFGPDAAKGNMGNPSARAALKVKESVELIEREDTAHHVAKTLIQMGVRHDTPEHEVLKKIPHALKKHGLHNNKSIQRDPDFHGDVFDSLSDLHKKKESVELDEAHAYSKAANALRDYANKHGGMDKKDFHTAAKHLDNVGKAGIMQKGQHLAKMNAHFKGLDTDVRDRIHMTLKQCGVMEAVQVDELSKATHDKYQKAAFSNAALGMAKKRMGTMSTKDAYDNEKKRYAGIDRSKYLSRKMKEENLDELKKSTLGNYVKVAAKDAASKAYGAASAAKDNRVDQSGKDFSTSMKRLRGIDTATKKLAKEGFNSDLYNSDVAKRAHVGKVRRKRQPDGSWRYHADIHNHVKAKALGRKDTTYSTSGAGLGYKSKKHAKDIADKIAHMHNTGSGDKQVKMGNLTNPRSYKVHSDHHAKYGNVKEAKSFDQKFRDHLKFAVSKSPAVQAYMKKRKADRDAAHAKQDPAAVKKNYGPAVIPPGTAYNKASKRGMNPSQAANAVSTAFKNRAKGGKLPK